MHKFFSIVGLAALVLVGCSGDSGNSNNSPAVTPTATNEAPTSDFKVALITPGPVNDSGWSALAYDGLQGIKTDMGAEVSNQVAVGNDIKEAMRSYAQKGLLS